MTKAETLQKYLPCHATYGDFDLCVDCPYNPNPDKIWEYGCARGQDKMIDDAIALLKEQEPKLLTFDEVKKHFLVPKELFGSIEEYIDYVNDIDPLYMECNVEDAFVCHWRTHDNISMHLDDWKNEYGKTWRCWTQKPTHEQMKAVKWDD